METFLRDWFLMFALGALGLMAMAYFALKTSRYELPNDCDYEGFTDEPRGPRK